MKRLSFYFLLSLFVAACYPQNQIVWQDGSTSPRTQTRGEAMPKKPGSCFAKALIPNKTETHLIGEYAVFTGDATIEGVVLDTVAYLSQEATTKWVKKKADKNCLSANPEDCLVWCLVEVPEKRETFVVVSDTSTTDQYKMVNIEAEDIIKEGGYTEWIEVLCDEKLTQTISKQIQTSLQTANFYAGDINGKMTPETKTALSDYQKAKQLSIGQLYLETLDSLDVDY